MIEKVNPSHPDKIADRIAGALVDLAYTKGENPKVAVEVLIGHGRCYIIGECSIEFTIDEVESIVWRIAGEPLLIDFSIHPQDRHLANNQKKELRCGDNGIFKGTPISLEEAQISALAKSIYRDYPTDGKYIFANNQFIICQSNAKASNLIKQYPGAYINPLGDWTGGINVDTGATNRKLGSDMGYAVTGGGLHGKDLSKADVSVNIYAHILAQREQCDVKAYCAIGDQSVTFTSLNGSVMVPYTEVVAKAKMYVDKVGGFEKFAEWGLF